MDNAQRFAAVSWAALLVAGACTAYRQQHAPAPRPSPASTPAIASARSLAADFDALPTAEQLGRVRGETDELKIRLDADGRYSCCVEPSCNECLHQHGACDCHHEVEQDGPCGECTQAWIEGRGVLPGVDARDLLLRKLRRLESGAAADGHRH
jgi:hypothetical protein